MFSWNVEFSWRHVFAYIRVRASPSSPPEEFKIHLSSCIIFIIIPSCFFFFVGCVPPRWPRLVPLHRPHILLQFLHFSPFRFMLVIHHSSVANAGAQYANWMHLSYRYKRHSISFESSLPLTIDISSSNISNHSSLITSNSDEMLIYD